MLSGVWVVGGFVTVQVCGCRGLLCVRRGCCEKVFSRGGMEWQRGAKGKMMDSLGWGFWVVFVCVFTCWYVQFFILTGVFLCCVGGAGAGGLSACISLGGGWFLR